MPPAAGTGMLVGRNRELSLLNQLLERLVRGSGQFALIEGEAGAGKSRLLAEMLRDGEASGMAILYGAAEELERDRPLGALARALALDRRSPDDQRAAIRALLERDEVGESFSLAGAGQLRFRLVDSIALLVEELAQRTPTVLAIDDLHWVDALTVLTLHHLGRRLRHLPLALVGTLRPLPRSDNLERLVTEVAASGGLHLTLGPLDEEAVRALVGAQLGAEPGATLLGLVARAGGNPFYVSELLSSLSDEGAIEVAGDRAEATRTTAPASLRTAVLRRLGLVSHDSLDVVRTASVFGSSFSVSDLATVLGSSPLELVAPLDEAVRAGLLGELGDRLSFRHDVVREAVYEAIPRPLRNAIHLQMGRALSAAGAAPTEVASHFALGAGQGDAEALGWIVRAARQIGPFAPDGSAGLLRRAVELTHPADSQRDTLVVELVWALVWAGRFAEARRLASEVLARSADPMAVGMLHLVLAKALQAEGRIAESLRELEAGLAHQGLPETVRARLLADLAGRRLHCRDVVGAQAAAEEALADAERIANPPAACAALSCLSFLATLQGRLEEAEALSSRSITVAERDSTGEAARAMPWVFAAYHRIQADRLEEVDAMVRRGRDADVAGIAAPVYHSLTALARYQQGRWDDAVAEAETSLALADETGTRVLSLMAQAVIAHIALHRGDLGATRSALAAAHAELQLTGPARFGLPWLLWAEAVLLEAGADSAGALALLEGVWTLLHSLGTPAECYEVAPELVRLALWAGRTELAGSVAAGMEALAGRVRTASARATARRCRGLLDGDPAALRDAVAALRMSGRVLELARAAEEAGRTLSRDQRAEAVASFEEALDAYGRLGAARDRARVESELRALGVRRGRRGPRDRPAVGWSSLTPAEAAVVRLTLEGLTNRAIAERLYISHRTVATHLSHVFEKLGLSTRVQLVAEASRRPELVGVWRGP